ASSAGEIDAYDLQVDVLSVEASTAASAKVHVVKELEARASTAGNIRFRGNPTKSRTDSSTGASVKKSYYNYCTDASPFSDRSSAGRSFRYFPSRRYFCVPKH